jgi:hypothetical protein
MVDALLEEIDKWEAEEQEHGKLKAQQLPQQLSEGRMDLPLLKG